MLFKLETVNLIYQFAEGSSSIKYYVRKEDIFGEIQDGHLAVGIGLGGRNRMIKETQTKQKKITAEIIMCNRKNKIIEKRKTVKSNLETQAFKMTMSSREILLQGKVGDTAKVQGPDVENNVGSNNGS